MRKAYKKIRALIDFLKKEDVVIEETERKKDGTVVIISRDRVSAICIDNEDLKRMVSFCKHGKEPKIDYRDYQTVIVSVDRMLNFLTLLNKYGVERVKIKAKDDFPLVMISGDIEVRYLIAPIEEHQV